MKEDITEQVEQCGICKQWFILEVEGIGEICDKCLDEKAHLNGEWAEGEIAL